MISWWVGVIYLLIGLFLLGSSSRWDFPFLYVENLKDKPEKFWRTRIVVDHFSEGHVDNGSAFATFIFWPLLVFVFILITLFKTFKFFRNGFRL
jgi:hypothetical protein